MTQELFTWNTLATFAGASMATGIITQLLKDIIKIPTQILAYLVALVILIMVNLSSESFSLDSILLCIINAFIVASAASNTVAGINRFSP